MLWEDGAGIGDHTERRQDKELPSFPSHHIPSSHSSASPMPPLMRPKEMVWWSVQVSRGSSWFMPSHRFGDRPTHTNVEMLLKREKSSHHPPPLPPLLSSTANPALGHRAAYTESNTILIGQRTHDFYLWQPWQVLGPGKEPFPIL